MKSETKMEESRKRWKEGIRREGGLRENEEDNTEGKMGR
jgi:hypothetical protein